MCGSRGASLSGTVPPRDDVRDALVAAQGDFAGAQKNQETAISRAKMLIPHAAHAASPHSVAAPPSTATTTVTATTG